MVKKPLHFEVRPLLNMRYTETQYVVFRTVRITTQTFVDTKTDKLTSYTAVYAGFVLRVCVYFCVDVTKSECTEITKDSTDIFLC
jgi:hypothetical protein